MKTMLYFKKMHTGIRCEYEGTETDCPTCGGDAIVNDSGVFCPDCDNN